MHICVVKPTELTCLSENLGIGKNGELPWRLSAELKHFARVTKRVQDPHKQVLPAPYLQFERLFRKPIMFFSFLGTITLRLLFTARGPSAYSGGGE